MKEKRKTVEAGRGLGGEGKMNREEETQKQGKQRKSIQKNADYILGLFQICFRLVRPK